MMPANIENICKKICVERFLWAILCSIGSQFFFLTIFLLFVNFNILHPWLWITQSLSLVFSFYTWIWATPLTCSIIIYGILLAKYYLRVKIFYPTRIIMIQKTFIRTILFVIIHTVVGFLTAWLYSTFLRDSYTTIFIKCGEHYCLNEKYLFLIFNGSFTGVYYFLKERIKNSGTLTFPVVHQSKYLQIRSNIYRVVNRSMLQSIMPFFYYVGFYYTFGGIFAKKLAYVLGTNMQTDTLFGSFYLMITDFRLIFYIWILSSQILSNMYLIDVLVSIFLTDPKNFTIEQPALVNESVSLVNALGMRKVPIIHQLACLDLFFIGNNNMCDRRKEIFTLSVPGGHPYSWNALSKQCLEVIKDYVEQLSQSIQTTNSDKANQADINKIKLKPTATELAERIKIRQYNESFEIRNMSMQNDLKQQIPVAHIKKYNELYLSYQAKIALIKKSIYHAPGIYYLFGESSNDYTCFMLAQSQEIIWLVQGLTGIISHSITEDKYGVVQLKLTEIVQALLQFKNVLDKISTVNLIAKKIDRNYISLKSAVKRSLYRICTTFSDNLKDLIMEPQDYRMLQCFINYKET